MAENTRTADENGIPQSLNPQERSAALQAFCQANDKPSQIKVLVQYPFLAGKDWADYAPDDYLPGFKAPKPAVPATVPTT